MITVRRIAPGDVEALGRHVKPEPLLHEARAQLQREGRAVYLIALEEERPVGHAFVMFPPLGRSHPRPPDVAEVEDLFVAAGCRSAGVGTRLLAEAERVARSRGFREIGLVVGVDNAAAQRLYARLGFEESDLGDFWVEGARAVCRYLVKPL